MRKILVFLFMVFFIVACTQPQKQDVSKTSEINQQNQQSQINVAKQTVKEFTIKASRFKFDPGIITVNKGDRVKITVENVDTLHGINIIDLGISGNDVVEFVADKSGTFTFQCNNVCGEGHKEMKGTLRVT